MFCLRLTGCWGVFQILINFRIFSTGLPLRGVVCRGALVSFGCRFRSVLTVVRDMPPVAFALVYFLILSEVVWLVVAVLVLLLDGCLRKGDL